MTRRYYIFVLIILFALIALSNRYLPRFQGLSPKHQSDPETSDYYLENMTSQVLKANGQLDYAIKAHRLVHFPEQDTTRLEQVIFHSYQADPGEWSIHAEQGEMASQQVIHLYGNVQLQRNASRVADALTLSTNELHIFNKKDYAETPSTVKIIAGLNQVTATGMRLYFKQGRIEFLSGIRGTYHVSP